MDYDSDTYMEVFQDEVEQGILEEDSEDDRVVKELDRVKEMSPYRDESKNRVRSSSGRGTQSGSRMYNDAIKKMDNKERKTFEA